MYYPAAVFLDKFVTIAGVVGAISLSFSVLLIVLCSIMYHKRLIVKFISQVSNNGIFFQRGRQKKLDYQVSLKHEMAMIDEREENDDSLSEVVRTMESGLECELLI